MAEMSRSTMVARPEPHVQARVAHLPTPSITSSRWILHAIVLGVGLSALVAKVVA